MRTLAAHLGQLARVQPVPGQVHQRVRPALGRAAPAVARPRRPGDGLQGGAQQAAALGVEAAVQVPDAVQRLAQVQVAALALAHGLGQLTIGVHAVPEVAGDPAQVRGVELMGGPEQIGLGLAGGLQAHLLAAADDHGGVGEADPAGGEGPLGPGQVAQPAGDADLLGGGAGAQAAGRGQPGHGAEGALSGVAPGGVEGLDAAGDGGVERVPELVERPDLLALDPAGLAVEVLLAETAESPRQQRGRRGVRTGGIEGLRTHVRSIAGLAAQRKADVYEEALLAGMAEWDFEHRSQRADAEQEHARRRRSHTTGG